MSWNLCSKDEIGNALTAALLALELPGQATGAFYDGYVSALRVVAQALGVRFEPPRPEPPKMHVWDEEPRRLPAPRILGDDRL